MINAHAHAIRQALATHPRCTEPRERYQLVIAAAVRCGHAAEFQRSKLCRTRIKEILEELDSEFAPDTVETRAIHYALQHWQGFVRWCRRYPEHVTAMLIN